MGSQLQCSHRHSVYETLGGNGLNLAASGRGRGPWRAASQASLVVDSLRFGVESPDGVEIDLTDVSSTGGAGVDNDDLGGRRKASATASSSETSAGVASASEVDSGVLVGAGVFSAEPADATAAVLFVAVQDAADEDEEEHDGAETAEVASEVERNAAGSSVGRV